MTIEEPTFIPKSHHPCTIVLLVHDDMLDRYRHGDHTIQKDQIVDSCEVFKYDRGKHGRKLLPSTVDRNLRLPLGLPEICEFMLNNAKVACDAPLVQERKERGGNFPATFKASCSTFWPPSLNALILNS